MSKVAIVIPAYNEATVIGRVVSEVKTQQDFVVVVDDASTDATAAEAQTAGAVVLKHIINRGQGAALKTGIDFALAHGADIVVTFDADGQHAVSDIATLIATVEAGNVDVVLGSRFLGNTSNVPASRRFFLQLAVLFTRVVSHIRVTDTHNGLRAFSRTAAQMIRIVQDRMAHASEILDEIIRHHLRYTEVPVTITYSQYSTGKGEGNIAKLKIALKFLFHKIRQ